MSETMNGVKSLKHFNNVFSILEWLMRNEDTYKKTRKTLFIFIYGSKNGSTCSTVNISHLHSFPATSGHFLPIPITSGHFRSLSSLLVTSDLLKHTYDAVLCNEFLLCLKCPLHWRAKWHWIAWLSFKCVCHSQLFTASHY